MYWFPLYILAIVLLCLCWRAEGRRNKYNLLKAKAIKLAAKYDDDHEIHDYLDEVFECNPPQDKKLIIE